MISFESIQKFIEMYKKEYGVELSQQDAFNLFTNLVSFVKAAISEEKLDNNLEVCDKLEKKINL